MTNFDKFWQNIWQKGQYKRSKTTSKTQKITPKKPPYRPCTHTVQKGCTQCVSCCLTRFLRVHIGYPLRLLEDFTKKHRFLTLFFRVLQGVLLEFFQKFLLKFCCFYIGKDGEKNCQKFTKKIFRRVPFLRVMCRCNKKNVKKMSFFRKIFYRQRRRKNVF